MRLNFIYNLMNSAPVPPSDNGEMWRSYQTCWRSFAGPSKEDFHTNPLQILIIVDNLMMSIIVHIISLWNWY